MTAATLRRAVAIGIFAVSLLGLLPLVLDEPVGLAAAAPADQSVVEAAPQTVSLTFAGEIDRDSAHVTVLDADGRAVIAGRPVVDRYEIRQPVSISGSGGYSATYHVRFANGAVATGTVSFGVGDGAPPRVAGGHASHGGQIDPVTLTVLAANVVALVVIGWKLARRRPARTDPPT
ncbi:copper resistance CopC family protein [Polymorphospora sp. NPDC050346]|uniref:copper resistance CopC family protein n=1 Tax=Polymorphospora sp. NPDC050346 TaxID=3155780 RepID=UPI0033E6AE0C